MPDVGSQVYWHNIPGAPPPWKNKSEHMQMRNMSRRVPGRISNQRHFLAVPRSEFVVLRHQNRNRPPTKPRHWGIVLEPNLSPLLGLNMIMQELQVDPITREEATAAVTEVRNEYSTMTQQGLSQSSGRETNKKTNISSTQQDPATTAVCMQEAPLLEVVKILCESRGLDVQLFNKTKLSQQRRICNTDVSPRRRVIMAVDRWTPRFVCVLAVPDLPSRPNCSRFIQLIAPTSTPVPWRRLLRSGVRSLPPSECVVAAIQRGEEVSDTAHMSLAVDSNDIICGESIPRSSGVETRKRFYAAREGSCDESIHSNTSDDVSDTVNDAEMARFMGEPLFGVDEKVQDDPIFLTPTALLQRRVRREDFRHDWIQRLIEPESRQKLYALNTH